VRRKGFIVFVCLLLPLSVLAACRGGSPSPGRDPSAAIRLAYAEAETCTIQAVLTADYGDRVTVFQVLYTYRRNGDDTVEILAPPEIAGLKAVISQDGSSVQYQGVSLATGNLPGAGIAPVEALSGVLAALRDGHQTAWGREKFRATPSVTLDFASKAGDTEITRRFWMEERTGLLLYAEVAANGRRVLSIEVETLFMS
jgi:hypothetical protein